MSIRFRTILIAGGLLMSAFSQVAHADGMVPETTVVYINEGSETAMKVKNTSDKVSLLYVKLEHIPEDKETWFIATPPVSRVAPGESQLVRFIAANKEPLKQERLARVTFDGITERKDPGANQVSIRVRQNLPVILHPKSLPENKEPWKLLKWEKASGGLYVVNDSPYVVRLGSEATLLPTSQPAVLEKSYLLPGDKMQVLMPKGDASPAGQGAQSEGKKVLTEAERKVAIEAAKRLDPAVTGIRFQPATNYGFVVGVYEAPLVAASAAPVEDVAASNPDGARPSAVETRSR